MKLSLFVLWRGQTGWGDDSIRSFISFRMNRIVIQSYIMMIHNIYAVNQIPQKIRRVCRQFLIKWEQLFICQVFYSYRSKHTFFPMWLFWWRLFFHWIIRKHAILLYIFVYRYEITYCGIENILFHRLTIRPPHMLLEDRTIRPDWLSVDYLCSTMHWHNCYSVSTLLIIN